MTRKSKQTWTEVFKFLATVLTAVLGTLGVTSCGQ